MQPSLPLLATTLEIGDCRVEWTIRTFTLSQRTETLILYYGEEFVGI